MDKEGFRRFLQGYGKKPHVVAGLIGQVRQFAEYLGCERHKTLETAEAPDFQAYVAALEAGQRGAARTQVRGVALYYRFTGNAALASLAADMRAEDLSRVLVQLSRQEPAVAFQERHVSALPRQCAGRLQAK